MNAPGTASDTLRYSTGILIVCIAGFLGGFVSAIGALIEGGKEGPSEEPGAVPKTADQKKPAYIAAKGVPVWFFILGRCIVGIGGATAVLLAALSVHTFTGTGDVDLLALSALCFVAGSIGHRLLPMVAAQLEKRVGEAERKVDQADRKADQAIQSTGKAREEVKQAVKTIEQTKDVVGMHEAVITALNLLSQREKMPAVVDQEIQRLEKFSRDFPTERSVHVVLGRLYRKKGDLDGAIAVLQGFIERKGTSRDKNVADAYFNIACYFSLKSGEAKSEEDKERYIDAGITAIRESLQIEPEGQQDVETDPDLEVLRASPKLATALQAAEHHET